MRLDVEDRRERWRDAALGRRLHVRRRGARDRRVLPRRAARTSSAGSTSSRNAGAAGSAPRSWLREPRRACAPAAATSRRSGSSPPTTPHAPSTPASASCPTGPPGSTRARASTRSASRCPYELGGARRGGADRHRPPPGPRIPARGLTRRPGGSPRRTRRRGSPAGRGGGLDRRPPSGSRGERGVCRLGKLTGVSVDTPPCRRRRRPPARAGGHGASARRPPGRAGGPGASARRPPGRAGGPGARPLPLAGGPCRGARRPPPRAFHAAARDARGRPSIAAP